MPKILEEIKSQSNNEIMINLSTNKQLNIILANTNKALFEALKTASPKELELITQNKDLKSIMSSLLQESSKNSESNKALLQLLKNNPTLKDLGNVSTTINNLLKSIDKQQSTLHTEKVLKEFLLDMNKLTQNSLKTKLSNSGVFLESKLKDAQNPQLQLKNLLQSLQTIVEKSPIYPIKSLTKLIDNLLSSDILKNATNTSLTKTFLEDNKSLTNLAKGVEKIIHTIQSNTKDMSLILNELSKFNSPEKLSASNNIKEIIANDLKSILLQANEEINNSSHPNKAELLKHIDKLSLGIDYYQLMSHLSNNSSIYLPFSWDTLEEGQINLKKTEDDKFYCDIELKLKEYGELHVRLVLYEKNQINLQIHSSNADFQKIVKENISLLRSALIEANITPREIRIKDSTCKNTKTAYEDATQGINIGFEVKV